ncbi:tudor domain-containing protein 7B isoform X2 [Syngnathoides biaculeatus]|uniref:tudor domain-containing protein 7B isoform X2 n=1 Tax=Syngnathoides biaculeatus TaxID=300417 RepID=UPI002ADD89B6|nr:tudor domain-containing protein 7B isoform X2 [Syngnathoides biaculeatus]
MSTLTAASRGCAARPARGLVVIPTAWRKGPIRPRRGGCARPGCVTSTQPQNHTGRAEPTPPTPKLPNLEVTMSDGELVKKMLRVILQANKGGMSLSRLQSEYKELTGEPIPHKQMGHDHLDTLLAGMPSVVHVERGRSGEAAYFASADKDAAHVAKVMARQRGSKKTGRPHLVNTQMRVKPTALLVLNAKPQTSLRQPNYRGRGGARGGAGHGDSRRSRDPKDGQAESGTASQHQKTFNQTPPRSNGFWVSKLPQIYKELYNQDLPTEAIRDLETWKHICTVERTCSSNPSELLLYPAKAQTTAPTSSSSAPPQSPVHQKPQLKRSDSRPPSSSPGPPSSPASLSPELKLKLEELLLKYSSGLWAHALPKLFQDAYKTKLPGHVLDDLQLLSDICTVDYPMPDNPKRAILYRRSSGGGGGAEDQNWNRRGSTAAEEERRAKRDEAKRLCDYPVPALHVPKDEYPSVLAVEAANTNQVVIRYIGESYSQAQERMEDEMREFYSPDRNKMNPCSSPSSGQLVAVKGEEEEEVLRAQVCELVGDKVKVHFVDHGFSEVVGKAKLFELHEKFFQLPFQATKGQLAGLEPFCQDPAVLATFEAMASGRILLAEVLQRSQTPLMVLYDTSQDDDVNINAACMKALQDETLSSPLQVNSAYMNVSVTSVCSDGTLSCQIPSRGLAKLTEVLENIETYFTSQVTSELLVSRPFCGKRCMARFKGKWSRVEITNLHGSRVLDIVFLDVGVQASVEVFELREIPQKFLRDLMALPPQAVKCCLADVSASVGSWTPDAVQWLREKVLNATDCSMKVARVDKSKQCVSVHLFADKNFHDPACSLNRQMARLDLFKQQPDVYLTSHSPIKLGAPAKTSSGDVSNGSPRSAPVAGRSHLARLPSGAKGSPRATPDGPPGAQPSPSPSLALPPLLELPPAGNNMDVYVSVACHPGHFVLQPWRDMYKLVVLMGEMILFYNQSDQRPPNVQKNHVYAAKVECNWYRVLVKGVLTNGLVSVYELDYGKHELVSCTQLRVLNKEFRQLPFQGITAQLAGVKTRHWSEEASMVFRNHVEKKPLVAQLEAAQEAADPWDRKLTVFLVDTSQQDDDIWVHDIMAEFADELA